MPTPDTVFLATLFLDVANLVGIPVAAAAQWRKATIATTDGRRGLRFRRLRRFWVLWGAGMELMLLSQLTVLAMYRPQPTMTPWIAAGLASVRTIPFEVGITTFAVGMIFIFIAASALSLNRRG